MDGKLIQRAGLQLACLGQSLNSFSTLFIRINLLIKPFYDCLWRTVLKKDSSIEIRMTGYEGRGNAEPAAFLLSISYQIPLAVTKGQMTQHSVNGYTPSDTHHKIDEIFDFAVGRRHQTWQLDYRAVLKPSISIFASMSRHKNWGNQDSRKNNILFAGLNITL